MDNLAEGTNENPKAGKLGKEKNAISSPIPVNQYTPKQWTPTPKQKAYFDVLYSAENGVTDIELCKRAGCSPMSYYTWRREDLNFRNAYEDLLDQRLKARMHQVDNRLIGAAETIDNKHRNFVPVLRTFYERAGKLGPQANTGGNVTINLGSIPRPAMPDSGMIDV